VENDMQPVRVAVHASDPVTHLGLVEELGGRSDMVVVDSPPPTEADVAVLAVEDVDAQVISTVRHWANSATAPIMLITRELCESRLLTLVECRVVAVLPRSELTGDRLVAGVLTAAGGNVSMPPSLLRSLLRHVERIHRDLLDPMGLNAIGLNSREINVLRLVADGWDNAQIARELCYSERTVKNVIYALTSRLNLRNRAQAVAYAVRAGVI
jgi:DNA-binding NarL/FixJ family response regulator